MTRPDPTTKKKGRKRSPLVAIDKKLDFCIVRRRGTSTRARSFQEKRNIPFWKERSKGHYEFAPCTRPRAVLALFELPNAASSSSMNPTPILWRHNFLEYAHFNLIPSEEARGYRKYLRYRLERAPRMSRNRCFLYCLCATNLLAVKNWEIGWLFSKRNEFYSALKVKKLYNTSRSLFYSRIQIVNFFWALHIFLGCAFLLTH